MSPDPLADLLAESRLAAGLGFAQTDAEPADLTLEQWDAAQAEWLRANRDRVLEALGGASATAGEVSDYLNPANRSIRMWWFAPEPGEVAYDQSCGTAMHVPSPGRAPRASGGVPSSSSGPERPVPTAARPR